MKEGHMRNQEIMAQTMRFGT